MLLPKPVEARDREILEYLRGARGYFPSHPTFLDGFVVRLSVVDGGQAFFKFYRFYVDPTTAYLDELAVTQEARQTSVVVGTEMLGVNELGGWAAAMMASEGCAPRNR